MHKRQRIHTQALRHVSGLEVNEIQTGDKSPVCRLENEGTGNFVRALCCTDRLRLLVASSARPFTCDA